MRPQCIPKAFLTHLQCCLKCIPNASSMHPQWILKASQCIPNGFVSFPNHSKHMLVSTVFCFINIFKHKCTHIGGFYLPCIMFQALSLVSYGIEIEMVPGRLGLLVTLFLIATNVYNSVNAPFNRGFSYIEIWMIGVQSPIIWAIFEYGFLLGWKKFHFSCCHQKTNKGKFINHVDTIPNFWTILWFLPLFGHFLPCLDHF